MCMTVIGVLDWQVLISSRPVSCRETTERWFIRLPDVIGSLSVSVHFHTPQLIADLIQYRPPQLIKAVRIREVGYRAIPLPNACLKARTEMLRETQDQLHAQAQFNMPTMRRQSKLLCTTDPMLETLDRPSCPSTKPSIGMKTIVPLAMPIEPVLYILMMLRRAAHKEMTSSASTNTSSGRSLVKGHRILDTCRTSRCRNPWRRRLELATMEVTMGSVEGMA